jgi:hypothetical protein
MSGYEATFSRVLPLKNEPIIVDFTRIQASDFYTFPKIDLLGTHSNSQTSQINLLKPSGNFTYRQV